MPYYAVKVGKQPGIYTSWEEAKQQVNGYQNAVYKKFKTKEEALAFLNSNKFNSDHDSVDNNFPIAYVDGSFRAEVPSAGIYIKLPNGTSHEFSFIIDQFKESHQIAGELFASLYAIKWAKEKGYKKLTIVYDYEGVRAFATNDWVPKSKIAKLYKKLYNKISSGIEVNFVSVKAHTNIDGNNRADKLAKNAFLNGNKWLFIDQIIQSLRNFNYSKIQNALAIMSGILSLFF